MSDDKKPKTEEKDEAAKPAEATDESKVKAIRRNKRKTVTSGRIYIKAGFNNTLVTFTDEDGKTLCQSSAGAAGFKGSKKSTPYAAQMAAEAATEKARAYGFEKGDVFVKGVGVGREQALRGIIAGGVQIGSISDITPIPHNGCRQPRTRRI